MTFKFLRLLGGILVSMLLSAYIAFLLQVMWGWFVVAQFGVDPLNFWAGWGILWMIALAGLKTPKEGDEEDLVVVAIYTVLMSTLILKIGFLIKTIGGL
jgi:hypothetical protein